jgi:putative nucleotidyltransferase with HDIG domain
MNFSRIDYDGKPADMAIVRDITERKAAEEERQQSTKKLLQALREAIEAVAMTVEIRDPYTSGHQKRVTDLAASIAREMELTDDEIEAVQMSAVVHDIGKLYVPAELLAKPGILNEVELSMIKLHAQAGYDILKTVEFPWPIAQIVLQHHERLDGSGYPKGLKENEILLEAKILAVADVVESIASFRPYRPALGLDAALEEISRYRASIMIWLRLMLACAFSERKVIRS